MSAFAPAASPGQICRRPVRAGLKALSAIGLLALTAFQAWAFWERLVLSLGPRVILQPWLLQRGWVMYEQIADPHTPLMPLALAALAPLLPDGLTLAKMALVALLSLTTLLAATAAWRRAGPLGGLAAAGFIVIWSPVFGFSKLWHESFLAPLYLLLFLGYDASARRRRAGCLLLLGVVGGLAVIVKQHAALGFAAYLLWTALTGYSAGRRPRTFLREAGLMALGALLVGAACVAYQAVRAGTLVGMLYWTVAYPLTSDYGALAALPPTASQVATLASACLLLPAAVACLVDAVRRGDPIWRELGLGLVLLAASAVTVVPRFGFFHLQPFLPLLAVVSVLTLSYALRHGSPGRPFATGMAVGLAAFWLVTRAPAYRPVLETAPRHIYEYTDLVPLAEEMRAAIGPVDCVYLFPDDEAVSNLYYLLGCQPPRFWIFHYPWYLSPPLVQQSLAALRADPPPWVAYFPDRWDPAAAPELVTYLQDHYRAEVTLPWAQGSVILMRRRP